MFGFVVGEVILSDVGDMGAGVVLLEEERLAAEELLDCWKELIFEQFPVPGAVDVAEDDERTDETPPREPP